jgi:hypothetical protein
MKTITNTIYFAFAAIALACLTLSSSARAQLNPPPDGGYPNQNTAEGEDALFNLPTCNPIIRPCNNNTAVGFHTLFMNIYGSYNTATGAFALMNNNFGGDYNTATGAFALMNNTNGSGNTATGMEALQNSTTGSSNTADGLQALYSNITGNNNTATGTEALRNSTAGNFNTAHGFQALYSSMTGGKNTAIGARALGDEGLGNTGSFNTATGVDALHKNTTGQWNTANGVQALFNNNTGSQNSATGANSLLHNTAGHDNVAVGVAALQNNTTGSFNIAIGSNAGANLTAGTDNIIIGPPGAAGDTNTIRIGATGKQTATLIAGISGATVAGGVGVIVGTNGKLGTVVSSARFKEAVQPMDKASEAILALKPVTFRYKKELDPEGIPQFGLVAEEVEKVNPDLVARDDQGRPYTVRYEAVNAMLLNEFLKEHRTVQELKTTVVEQQKQIEALTAGLQKVSAQLEVSKPAPQTAVNNQ